MKAETGESAVAKFESNEFGDTIKIEMAVSGEPKIMFNDTWSIGPNATSGNLMLGLASGPAIEINPKTLEVRFAGGLASESTLLHSSDRAKKEAFQEIDVEQVLESVLNVPITTWRFKTEDESVRHIGPTSQDFKAAFDVGTNERYINTVDADGVALAAIQGLNKRLVDELEHRDRQISEMMERIEALEAQTQ